MTSSLFNNWIQMLNPLLLFSLIIIYISFMKWVKRLGIRREKVMTKRQQRFFLLGLIVLYITFAGPVQLLAKQMLFSAHMFQQSILFIVVPPLLLLATPEWLVKPIAQKVTDRTMFKVIASPLFALIMFNFLWSIVHLPVVFEFVMMSSMLMVAAKLVIMTMAFLMWIHVFPPVASLDRLTEIHKIGYMFANGMLITPACALIIFSGDVIYPSLLEGQAPFAAFLSPLADQQTGGVVMKVVQELSYGTVIGYIFFKWAKKEKEADKQAILSHKLGYLEGE